MSTPDRITSAVEQVVADLRHALRALSRMPGLAAVVVLSLGAGIGVNTAVFSWIQAMVLRPLPGVEDASSFHTVEPRAPTGGFPGASWPEARDLRERLGSFRDLLAFRMVPLNVGEAPETERTYGLLVSGNYFEGLGLEPALGRLLGPADAARPGDEPVAVISHEYWRRRFASSPEVLGRTLRVNGQELSVVGVTPEGFQGTVLMLSFDLWLPATMAPVLLPGSGELDDRSQRGVTVMGSLAEGVTPARAQAELDAAMEELGRIHPETGGEMAGEVRPFWRAPRGPQEMMARALGVLQAILLLLLLAVCGNAASLLVARGATRQREVGVRLAVGAGRWRVVRLMLTESLLLALLGAGVGILVALWGTEALRAVPITGAFPIRFTTSIDGPVLAFAAGLGVACGLVFGLVPAVKLARLDPLRALRAGAGLPGRGAPGNVLMAGQVALALVVLVVAAAFLDSFRETRSTDPGFRREGVLLAAYDLSSRDVDLAAARRFAARLLERLEALPEVESAAIAAFVPLDIHGLPLRPFTLEGRGRDEAGVDRVLTNVVTPGYFRTMGLRLVEGSDLADLADAATAPQVVVNREFVRRYLAGAEPVGRRLGSGGESFAIAGVVEDSLYESFSEPPTPMIHFSYRDRPWSGGEIHVRTRPGAETVLAPVLERVVRDLDPALPVYDVRTLTDHVERNLVLRRIPARMFAVLGPLLLVLAAIGIYAVVAHAVARRTAEIGIRRALGATAGRVVFQVVADGLRTVAFGVLPGWLVAFAVTRLPMVRASQALLLAGVPALLMLVAALACWLPARRAARIDPVSALSRE